MNKFTVLAHYDLNNNSLTTNLDDLEGVRCYLFRVHVDVYSGKTFVTMITENKTTLVLSHPNYYVVYIMTDPDSELAEYYEKVTGKSLPYNTTKVVDGASLLYDRNYKCVVHKVYLSNYSDYKQVISALDYSQVSIRLMSYDSLEMTFLREMSWDNRHYLTIKSGAFEVINDTKDHFNVHLKTAGFDFEFDGFDYADPKNSIYLCGLYVEDKCWVISTKDYYPNYDLSYLGIKHVSVNNSAELVQELLRVLYEESPHLLVGYFSHFSDWKIAQQILARELLEPLSDPVTGVTPYFQQTKPLDKKSVSDKGLVPRLVRTAYYDLVPFATKVTPNGKVASFKLEHVCQYYLGRGKTGVTYEFLERVRRSGTLEERLQAIHYVRVDAELALSLSKKLNLQQYLIAMISRSSAFPEDLISQGMVNLAYGLVSRRCLELNILIDRPNTKAYRPAGGYVIDPTPGKHSNVATLDYSSLYPSIVQAWNIDYLTITSKQEGDYIEMLDMENNIHYIRQDIKDTILPNILHKLTTDRDSVKLELAKVKGKDEGYELRLSAMDFVLKELANSIVGVTAQHTPGTNSNPLRYCLINDLVTTCGRKTLENTVQFANRKGFEVIYGDTDSIFVKGPGDPEKLKDELNSVLRKPMKIKVERVFTNLVFLSKKRYLGTVFSEDGMLTLKASGNKPLLSSSCVAARELYNYIVTLLLVSSSPEEEEEAFAEYERCVQALETIVSDPNTASNALDLLQWNFKYTGKQYKSSTSFYGQVISDALDRGVYISSAQLENAVYVITREDYISKYNIDNPLLPSASDKKISSRVRFLNEIVRDPKCIDVRLTLAKQCLNSLYDVREALHSSYIVDR